MRIQHLIKALLIAALFVANSYAGETGGKSIHSMGPAPQPSAESIADFQKNHYKPLDPALAAKFVTGPAYGSDLFTVTWQRFPLNNPNFPSILGSQSGAPFAGDMDGTGQFYLIDSGSSNLVSVDTSSGGGTALGPITIAAGHTWTGLSYNPDDDQWYALSSDGITSTTYRINPAIPSATQLASSTVVPIGIDLAFASDGTCYVHEIAGDQIFEINPLDFTATLIGPTNFDANFAQGMDVDPETGDVYLAAYNLTTGAAELRLVDLTTGNALLLGNIGAGTGVEIAAFGISASQVEPTNPQPPNATTEVSNVSWDAAPGTGVTYRVQVFTDAGLAASELVLDREDITGTTLAFGTNLAPNSSYFWRVAAVNANRIQSAFSQVLSFTTPLRFALSGTANFTNRDRPGDFLTNDYKLVGIPGNSNSSVSSFLSGAQGTRWEIYRDSGANTDFLVKYDGTASFNATVGRAFWVIHDGRLDISINVPGAAIDEDGKVDIPLNSGFTQITNPYPVPVVWADVQNFNQDNTGNNLTEPLWAFNNGNYTQATTMQPFIGYYFDNSTFAQSTLEVPYQHDSSGKRAPAVKKTSGWQLVVDLNAGDFADQVVLGVSSDATAGRDRMDHLKPAGFGSAATIEILRSDWNLGRGVVFSDIRSEINETEGWDLLVKSIDGSNATLSFTGLQDIPAHLDILLVGSSENGFVNLREQTIHSFKPVASKTRFTVLIGKGPALQDRLAELLPKDFVLGQNYPNPFNPTTSIPLELPARSDISLKVFDILGKEVATIYTGSLETGSYDFQWDARDHNGYLVTSGIYLYRLTLNNNRTQSGKMILLK